MIIYDKKQKQIVIPNGIGNLDIFNNGVEVGYEQGKIDGINIQKAKLESINITENGTYSIDDQETIRSIAFDGYSYFNTGIFPTENIKIEACIKITNGNDSSFGGIIIGGGIGKLGESTENRGIAIGMNGGGIYGIWGAIKSRNKPYKIEGEGTTTVVLQKTDDSWVWDGEKGSFGASGLYIGGYNSNDIAVEKRFLQSIVYIKIWTDRNDDSTLITYTPKPNGNFDANGVELKRLGDGTTTYVKENVIKYPYGFKRVEVNVPDLNGSYDEGYEQGKIDGVNEQKSKLESINITENGTYDREDGYNHIEVNVPDLNGSYDEGYEQGQADVAANARVLNVTENGNYLSKFSDPIIPTTVTGVYADGTDFYSYAELKGKVFNTNIPATKDSRIELWWKNDDSYHMYNAIIGAQSDEGHIFKFIEMSANKYRIEYGNHKYGGNLFTYEFTYDMSSQWNHIIFSKQDGLYVNGELICEIQGEKWIENIAIPNFWINASSLGGVNDNANGYFGMIKINDTIIIPTANGFQNVNTGELLEVVKDGGYTFTENLPIYGEGELYKTINVNVKPKINIKEAGLKFGYSTFTEVPEWADFKGVKDMESMFYYCRNLQTIPQIDTSNAFTMNNMFSTCEHLRTISHIDTSNVNDMRNMFYRCIDLQTIPQLNTSNVTTMETMFSSCYSLQTIPSLDTSKVTRMPNMFNNCTSLVSIPALNAQSLDMPSYYGVFGSYELSKLTDFGGFLNLKLSLTNDNNLKKLPNLTYQSCINVLNGLYDFTGNGETPNSNQGKLKVHQNFLNKVGDEISIGTLKGWSISAG